MDLVVHLVLHTLYVGGALLGTDLHLRTSVKIIFVLYFRRRMGGLTAIFESITHLVHIVLVAFLKLLLNLVGTSALGFLLGVWVFRLMVGGKPH